MKRREFLRKGIKIGLAANALPLLVGGLPMQVFGKGNRNRLLPASDNGNILVLLQMQGGNDGLNCLVPISDPEYLNLRPNLGLSEAADGLFKISDHQSLAFHYKLPHLSSLYESGRVAILQNVGQPIFDLSHFHATDIVETATDGDIHMKSGWVGRLLQKEYPSFSMDSVAAGSDPLALHFGATTSRIFAAPVSPTAVSDMGIYANKLPGSDTASTHNYDPIPQNPSQAYQNLDYVRTVQRDTEVYNTTLASRSVVTNKVVYPDTTFAQQLASVAQLISSGLTTRIYVVTQSGYDFHSNLIKGQEANHIDFDNALFAFQNDLEAMGLADRVVTATYSEFGRRPTENGSGTDHGTAYPLFVIGTRVAGGVRGNDPDLKNLMTGGLAGNLNFNPQHDFRNVYTSLMSEWLGVDDQTIQDVLTASNGYTYSTNSDWTKLGLIRVAGVSAPTAATESQFGLTLLPNFPDPFTSSTAIQFAIPKASEVRLSVFNIAGEEVARLQESRLEPGNYERVFEAHGLPTGRYTYRLSTPESQLTRQMTLLR